MIVYNIRIAIEINCVKLSDDNVIHLEMILFIFRFLKLNIFFFSQILYLNELYLLLQYEGNEVNK